MLSNNKNNQVETNYDDSSDEEDHYERLHQQRKLLNNKSVNSTINNYGTMIITAPNVEQQYRKKKQEHLSGEGLDEKVFNDIINNVIYNMLLETFNIETESQASERFVKELKKLLKPNIDKFITECSQNKRELFHNIINKNNTLPRFLSDLFVDLCKQIGELIDQNKFDSLKLEFNSQSTKSLTASALLEDKNVRNIIIQQNTEHKNYVNLLNKVHNLLLDRHIGDVFLKGMQNFAKTKFKRTLFVKEPKLLQPFYEAFCQKAQLGWTPSDAYDAILREYLTPFVDDLISNEAKRDGSILHRKNIVKLSELQNSELSIFSNCIGSLQAYTKYNHDTFIKFRMKLLNNLKQLQKKFCCNFTYFYSKAIEDTPSLNELFTEKRKNLPDTFVSELSGIVDYLASLRLVYRDIRRHSKKNIFYKQQDSYNPTSCSDLTYLWKFKLGNNAYNVRDVVSVNPQGTVQHETATSTVNSSYEAIFNNLKHYSEHGIDDKDLAYWIRNILLNNEVEIDKGFNQKDITLKGHLKECLAKTLCSLTHLMFVVETMRYPGALIQNQMILDLVLKGEAKLTNKFITKEEQEKAVKNPDNNLPERIIMPMSMKKIVPNCRDLSNKHNIKAVNQREFHKHTYLGPEKGKYITLFKSLEKQLANKWLKSCGANKKSLDESINMAIKDWFPGIGLDAAESKSKSHAKKELNRGYLCDVGIMM